MKRKFVIADQNAVSAEGHFRTYTNALALAARDAGHDVTVLWNKRFPLDTLAAPYRTLLTFSHTEGEADAHGILPYGEGHFGWELERAIGPLRLGANDLVIVHTCHFVELFELLDYLGAIPPAKNSPSFHVVARYDPDIFQFRMGRLTRRFDAISRSESLRDKIRFHSDTEQLATEFSRLFGTPVGVCPIPVDLTRLLPKLADASERKAPAGPLTATYLGTARSEKGYRDILDAIAFIRESHIATDRLQFVLQCSDQSLRGEPGLLDYQKRLEDYLREKNLERKVRFIKDIIDTDDYCSLLAQSDIVLLGYSPSSYRCRSSSVLVEAMAAGKIVVTTSGSWMASRVGADHAICYAGSSGLGPAIAEAVDRFEELAAGAKARQKDVIAASDPAALAAYFVDASAHCPSAAAADMVPMALMVMDGDALAAGSDAANVFTSRLRYCNSAGYRVVALFLDSGTAGDTAGRRRRLADALRPYSLERVFIERRDGTASGEIVSFLSECRPDCIVLSQSSDYAFVEMLGLTDLPVALETNGRVSSLRGAKAFHDVGAKRDVLSTCASEALEARTFVPAFSGIHCTFPFSLKAPGLDALAGPVNCLEVVASARPLLPEFDLETNPALARSRRFSRLASLESLDLLFVSAASGAAVDGLHWFLEKVYRPFLSQRRISLIVAGEIASLGPFPIFDDVVFIGPVERREPLYAAAKIVIAPMQGSDGGALELLEALSKAMPIVATTASIEKIGGVAAGLEAHDGERAFAEAISHLLDAPERRASAAAASFATARRLGAGSASILAMDALFRSLLGERAIAAPIDEPCVLPDTPVEWTPAIGAANSFLRSYVAGAPLEGLGELARQPDEGLRLVTQIADALLERRNTPLLQVDGHLLAKLTRLADVSLAADAASIARIALASAVLLAPQSGQTPSLVVNRQFSGVVVERVRRGQSKNARPTAVGVLFSRALPELVGETIAWEFARDERDAPKFCLLALGDIAEEDDWIVFHRVPLSRRLRGPGGRVFANWRFAPRNDDRSGEERLFLSRQPIAAQTKSTWATGISAIFSSGRRSPLYKWSPWARANPLFDADWYIGEYPDVVEKKIVPFKHYNHSGVREGRNPNPLFDTNWYLERYPEVRNSGENPLDHYFEAGAFEDYDPGPFFSTSRYLDDNPDVKAARLNPLLHYLEYGRREGREIHPPEPIRAFQSILSPAVVGVRGTPWIEIEFITEAGWELTPLIEVSCGERKLEFRVYHGADRALLRAVLPRAQAETGAVRLRAALRPGPVDRIEISAIRVGWSSGGPEIALEQVERMSRGQFGA